MAIRDAYADAAAKAAASSYNKQKQTGQVKTTSGGTVTTTTSKPSSTGAEYTFRQAMTPSSGASTTDTSSAKAGIANKVSGWINGLSSGDTGTSSGDSGLGAMSWSEYNSMYGGDYDTPSFKADLSGYNAAANAIKQQQAYYEQMAQANRDAAMRDAYISYMQNRLTEPERLNNLGYTGGLTETSGLRLLSNYEDARRRAYQDYDANVLNAALGTQSSLAGIYADRAAAQAQAAQAEWEAEQQARQNNFNNYLNYMQLMNSQRSGQSGGQSGEDKEMFDNTGEKETGQTTTVTRSAVPQQAQNAQNAVKYGLNWASLFI